MNQTKYGMGRSVANGIIIIGWVVVVVLSFLAISSSHGGADHSIILFLAGFFLGGVVNHGLAQTMLAIFDIADNTRDMTKLLEASSRPSEKSVPIPADTRGLEFAPLGVVQGAAVKQCPKCYFPSGEGEKRCAKCGASLSNL